MRFKVVGGAGVGAAAIAVGLSLAGPQALGVANADTAATDSASVSAGPAEPGAVSGNESSPARAAAGRGGRGVKPSESVVSEVRPLASADVTSVRQTPAGEAARRSVRGSVSVRPVAVVADRRNSVAVTPHGFGGSVPSVPSAPDVVSGVREVVVAVPSAAAVVADPARVPARAQRGAATRAAVAGDPATVPEGVQYVVASVSGSILDSLHSFFDSASTWLATLPEGPVHDFLEGALLLARRTVLPSGPNPFGSGYDSSVGNDKPWPDPYNPPTEPAPDFPTNNLNPTNWYRVVDVLNNAGDLRRNGPVLRGTSGAVYFGPMGGGWPDDGVKGIITNMSGQPIVVETQSFSAGSYDRNYAIMLPNDWMPYMINDAKLKIYGINLFKYNPKDLPQPVSPRDTAELYLLDPYWAFSDPYVDYAFAGKGGRVPLDEGQVVDLAGDGYRYRDFQVTVRRLPDKSWTVPVSEAYKKRYPFSPESLATRDWAIFNIEIRELPFAGTGRD